MTELTKTELTKTELAKTELTKTELTDPAELEVGRPLVLTEATLLPVAHSASRCGPNARGTGSPGAWL